METLISDQGLHGLPMPHKKDPRLIWVKGILLFVPKYLDKEDRANSEYPDQTISGCSEFTLLVISAQPVALCTYFTDNNESAEGRRMAIEIIS